MLEAQKAEAEKEAKAKKEESAKAQKPKAEAKKAEPKASPKQVELLNKLYKADEMQTIYDWYKVSKLEDLTVQQASKLIEKRAKK